MKLAVTATSSYTAYCLLLTVYWIREWSVRIPYLRKVF